MKVFSSILAVAAVLAGIAEAAPVVEHTTGFNIGHTRPDGSCKKLADWKTDLLRIRDTWNAGNTGKQRYNAIKIFSTGDCYALQNAVTAIKEIGGGIKVYAGVWNVPDWKFDQDKAALEKVMRLNIDNNKWLAGINVGSESFYREEVTAEKLAGQIWDVKGMVQNSLGAGHVAVGTADTWTSWVDGRFKPVIAAVDVAIMNGFPYWQDVSINTGLSKLQEAIANTRRAVGWSKPFVIGETGWPSAGPTRGQAVASVANTQAYWKAAVCWLQQRDYPWFWFSAFDEPQRESQVERNFGIAWSGRTPKAQMNINQLCKA